MKKDENDPGLKEQLTAEQAGLTKPPRASTPGQPPGKPEDLADAPPGAPTHVMPRAPSTPDADPDAAPTRPVNLPYEEGEEREPNPLAGSVSTLGQPTHIQPTKREKRGEHTPPKRRE